MSYPPGRPATRPAAAAAWPQPGSRRRGRQRRGAADVAHPHPEPRTYPLMLRTWDYAWWKPVVGILVLVVGGLSSCRCC